MAKVYSPSEVIGPDGIVCVSEKDVDGKVVSRFDAAREPFYDAEKGEKEPAFVLVKGDLWPAHDLLVDGVRQGFPEVKVAIGAHLEIRELLPLECPQAIQVKGKDERVYPSGVGVAWRMAARSPDGTRHECAVQQVAATRCWDDGSPYAAGSVLLDRSQGDLFKAPACDLSAAAARLAAAKTMEDVAALFTEILLEGVVR